MTTSYRFDGDLAAILTRFQYRADGITLTAATSRPLPAQAYDATTPGLEAVFERDASLVFVCYDDRRHQMVNPVETVLVDALAQALESGAPTRTDGGASEPLGEGPAQETPGQTVGTHPDQDGPPESATDSTGSPSLGVVTPHNAQRGAIETAFPTVITANTVEKYQGGQRDIIAVSATVSDPDFARREERFILNPRRLLVAISWSRLLTVVVCSTALFEVAPDDSARLEHGPVWARLFTQAVGRDAEPAWAGPLGEFTPTAVTASVHADIPVTVYPSTVDTSGGDQ
jgi:hypothetical protein